MQELSSLGQRPRLLLQANARGLRLSPFEAAVLLAILVAASYVGYTAYARVTDLNAPLPAEPLFLPASRTTLTSSVTATGSVQASQQVTLTFGVTGKIKEFLVGLGAQVTAGQPLARLDDADLQQALRSAESALASAQARLDAATRGPTASEIATAQQSLTSAQNQLATAQQALADLRAKPTPAEIASAQQAVLTAQNGLQTATDALLKAQNDLRQAQADLVTAQEDVSTKYEALRAAHSDLDRAASACTAGNPVVPALASRGSTAASVLTPSVFFQCNPTTTGGGTNNAGTPTPSTTSDPDLATYRSAVTQYNAAAAAYNTALTAQTAKQTAVTTAQNTLASGNLERAILNAQLGLASAQQRQAEVLAGPKASELEAAQRSIDAATASLASAQARYDDLFKPPSDDVILPLKASVDQASANVETAKKNLAGATIVAPFDGQIAQVNGEVGTQVSATTAVFILLNPRLIRVDASVDQADIASLQRGQRATVTFDALAGRSYEATVAAIGLTPTIQQGVVTYSVSLAVDTSALPPGTPVPTPGMTASINVTTSRTENALVVPARSIRRTGRTATVTVKTATGTEQRQVVTGASNGTLTQIVSGLQDGELVLYSTPVTSTSAARPTTTQPGQFFGPGGGAVPGGTFGR